MFFRRKHFIDFGYKVMGLDFGRNDTYNIYVKYFKELNSLVVCSTIHNNAVMVYRLTKEQYDDFILGKFALSHNGNGFGKTPSGHPIKNYGYINIFSGGELKNRKTLKKYLDQGEIIAQTTEPVIQVGILNNN